MKRFRFSLERALAVRRTQAEAERARLEPLLQAYSALDDELEARCAERDQCWLTAAPGTAPDLAALAGAERYRHYLAEVTARLEERRRQLAAQIDAQRAALIEARRRQELLEKLRARRRREWEAASIRELEELAGDAYRARLHGSRRAEKSQILGRILGQAGE